MAILFLIMMLGFSIMALNYRVKCLEERIKFEAKNEIAGKEIEE